MATTWGEDDISYRLVLEYLGLLQTVLMNTIDGIGLGAQAIRYNGNHIDFGFNELIQHFTNDSPVRHGVKSTSWLRDLEKLDTSEGVKYKENDM